MHSNAIFAVLLGVSLSAAIGAAQTPTSNDTGGQPTSAKSKTRYGANPSAGRTFVHDGVTLYYETYGAGEPLLLVHGNGGSIGDFKAQIDFFRKHYKVIAMDSRDQGRSGDSPVALTYEIMTGDLAALLDHLKVGPAYVLGWSDGAIEALELAMHYPAKVKRVAAMAANVEPDGAVPEIVTLVKDSLASMPAAAQETPAGRRELRLARVLLDEPHIPLAALETITAPTLILASDHDLIQDEHTLAIYHHIPNSELNIFPGATHMVPYDDPVLFNASVQRFFATPYVPKDRIKDVLKSLGSLKASQN